MKKEIDRIVSRNQMKDIVAMAVMLGSIPRKINSIDTLVVVPGQGENWRVQEAISVWDKPFSSAKYLLISGQYWEEKKYIPLDLEHLQKKPFNLKRSRGFYSQVRARHTKEQAYWIVEKVQELKVKSIALFVSPYHILRAYCTLLRTFNETETSWVPMIPIPVAVSPYTPIPETGASAWNLVPGEVERIIEYQKKGDVSSYDEFVSYINWLWKNFLKGGKDV